MFGRRWARRRIIWACGLVVVGCVLGLGGVARGNLITNPSFGGGSSGWYSSAPTQFGAWADSDGACAFVNPMSSGNGLIWQYIPGWKLPDTNTSLYYWDARKKWYGQNNRATIMLYGLKTVSAVSGNATPGGDSGVDYDILAGAGALSMGNGFWWSSEYYKWRIGEMISGMPIGYATQAKYPHGLLLSVQWGGGGAGGAGFDDFVLVTGSKGSAAGDPSIGSSTGEPRQSVVTRALGYTGIGVDSPWWIDPEWATGYEYAITRNEYWVSFKSVELPPIGDGMYAIDVWEGEDWLEVASDVETGEVLFSSIAPGRNVKQFRVRGIETSAEIDPDGHGFPVGVMFTSGGREVDVTMTALVPEPGTLGVIGVGVLVALRRWRCGLQGRAIALTASPSTRGGWWG